MIPIFQKYRSSWPIRDILKQYLSNHKKRHIKDLQVETEEKRVPKAVGAYKQVTDNGWKAGEGGESDDEEDEEDEDGEERSEDDDVDMGCLRKGKPQAASKDLLVCS